MAEAQPNLTEEQEEKLTELFRLLDADNSGKLDMQEFKLLGKAMTGVEPSDEETVMQLKRADRDQDGMLDLDEWLSFSQMLARLPKDMFEKTINVYLAKVKAERRL